MLESQERYFQYLAAKRFYEEASGDFTFYQEDPSDFTEDELREEAALRCWLRQLKPNDCPLALPTSAMLRAMADDYDDWYGEFAWWAWPVWSSCEVCSESITLCACCESYLRYCAMSEQWVSFSHTIRSRL